MLSTEGQKVVYWLGAGASVNALPVVQLMPSVLQVHVPRLRRLFPFRKDMDSALRKYELALQALAGYSMSYGTLDTYARSLYLRGDQQDALASLKLHMSMFFTLESALRWVPRDESNKDEYVQKYDLDPRYMGWLAVLLGDDLRMNPRVKVISWNYDFQVEWALARYCQAGSVDMVHERFGVHPSPGRSPISEVDFFLTHLNGIAGQERRADSFHPWYKGYEGFFPNWIQGVLEIYASDGPSGASMRSGFTDRFTFAWERNPIAERGIALAEFALRQAAVLVVIGYSFPAFNRLIDKRLLSAFDEGHFKKRIVLQSPNANRDHFLSMFDLDKDRISTDVDTNPDQFHLPKELFQV